MLIEIMGQDGALGPYVRPIENAALQALQGCRGYDALISVNLYIVQTRKDKASVVPRGFLADSFTKSHWPMVSADWLHHTLNPSVDCIGHLVKALGDTRVCVAKLSEQPLIRWTVPSSDQARIDQKGADVSMFQGFLP